MSEYAPIAIRDLMLADDAPAGLEVELGSGADARIWPVQMGEGSGFPACVYTELEEAMTASKDGGEVTAWTFELTAMSQSYVTTQKIARLARRAIHFKEIAVDEIGTIKLHYIDKEDLQYEEERDIYQTALTFRATKTY